MNLGAGDINWGGSPVDLAPGDSERVKVTYTATDVALDVPNLPADQNTLHILSNDPARPALELPVALIVGDATAVGEPPAVPAIAALGQNKPNPFNPATTITFALPAAARAVLALLGPDPWIDACANYLPGHARNQYSLPRGATPGGLCRWKNGCGTGLGQQC